MNSTSSTEGITDLTDRVSITDAQTGQRSCDLSTHGFGAVLCLDRRFINRPHPDRGVENRLCHLSNDGNSQAIFDDAVETLEGLLDEHSRVLVHCQYGKNRSVAVAAACLAKQLGISAEESLRRVSEARGGVVSESLRASVLRHCS